MKKVLVSDNISDAALDIMRRAGLEVVKKTGMKPEELKAVIGEYHGIAIRSATKLTADILEAATNLQVIGRAGSGLDNVDKAAATKKGIVVMNTPGGNTITTAEHAIAMMFAMARSVPQATASMRDGKWEKKRFMGMELYNKVLGIVGLGQIGSQVARKAIGLEMQVIAYDPFLSDEKARDMGITKGSLEDIFARADIITIHSPLTAETKNLICRDTIAKMKDGVRIVNCARGGIVNEADLLEALNSGKVASAALDVFEVEPPVDNPLVAHERVICTPHLGASTDEAQENVAVAVAEQIADYLVHGTIRNAVNFPSIPLDQVARLTPYIKLAEGLGSFAAQVLDGSITSVGLEFCGDSSTLKTEPIVIAALKGLLTPILEETVNYVNAPAIAKERGIKIEETLCADSGDYHSMLTLRVRGTDGEHRYSGTLFSRKDPRIIMVDRFPVEIIPEGTMLAISNNDKPGVIGGMGSLLAGYGINIAWMHFGREAPGGLAMSVISVDTALTDEQLAEIRALDNVLAARQIFL